MAIETKQIILLVSKFNGSLGIFLDHSYLATISTPVLQFYSFCKELTGEQIIKTSLDPTFPINNDVCSEQLYLSNDSRLPLSSTSMMIKIKMIIHSNSTINRKGIKTENFTKT